jgi:hypothetical protein
MMKNADTLRTLTAKATAATKAADLDLARYTGLSEDACAFTYQKYYEQWQKSVRRATRATSALASYQRGRAAVSRLTVVR